MKYILVAIVFTFVGGVVAMGSLTYAIQKEMDMAECQQQDEVV